ncbi:CinA domain-containing protein [Acidiphilium sp. PM]|nr:CinA domain-containing protein [Acidiphilium sp. PM]
MIGRAREAGRTIATAESCTGGMIAAALTDIAGASAVFGHGFVSYANDAKVAMLGVEPGLIAREGAVSETVARAMAEGARARAGADLAVAVTGIAGPEGGIGGEAGRHGLVRPRPEGRRDAGRAARLPRRPRRGAAGDGGPRARPAGRGAGIGHRPVGQGCSSDPVDRVERYVRSGRIGTRSGLFRFTRD